MQKRGISHIEVILSFVIFVTAVGFALFFFSPFNSERLVESSLSYGFREISKNVSVSIETFGVLVNNSGDNLPNNGIGILIEGVNAGGNKNVRVEQDEQIVDSRIDGDIVSVANLEEGEIFLFLKIGEGYVSFSPEPEVQTVSEEFYEISSWETEEFISESRFDVLGEAYNSNYDGLRDDFNLPRRAGFGFAIVFDDGDKIEAYREVPEGLEVFSKNERVGVLRNNGEIEFADLIVKVW